MCLVPLFSPSVGLLGHTHAQTLFSHTNTDEGSVLPSATSVMEKSSPVSSATAAPQQPDLETNTELGSAAKTELREEKRDEEEEKERERAAVGQSLDPEWVEERFRIDRKKLESMLYGE